MTPTGSAVLGDATFITRKMGGKIVRRREINKRGNIFNNDVLSAMDPIMQLVMPSKAVRRMGYTCIEKFRLPYLASH